MYPQEKTQVQRVQYANGTAAGIDEVVVETLSDYERVTGIYLPVPDSFSPPLRLGISDGQVTYHELVGIRHFAASLALAHEERFFPISIRAAGNQIRFQIQRTVALTADLDFDIIIRYEGIK